MTTENNENNTAPKVDENMSVQKDTINSSTEKEIIIPIKFNKEVKNLTVSQATELAQKGMKFDLILKDYEVLKRLSKAFGKSVPEFLCQLEREYYNKRYNELLDICKDEKLAEHVMGLEQKAAGKSDSSFADIMFYFPKIKSKEDLPQEVIEASELKGTLLLDEYLRYILESKKRLEDIEKNRKNIEGASVGSQGNRKSAVTPEAAEFLKGLWK